MADRWAVATGNWSSTSTWNGGTLPAAGDDVYADGRTVTIDQNVTVLSVRTTQRSGGTAGGTFVLNTGFTLTGNAIAGTNICVNFSSVSPNSATIVGNCIGGSTAGSDGVRNNSSGTVIVIGNCTGGSASPAHGVNNASVGTLTITGVCTGGTVTAADGVRNNSNGTATITGNCIGGSASTAHGARNITNGTIIITGDCTGGSSGSAEGVSNSSTGELTINGSAIGSSVAAGAINGSTGLMSVKRAVGNGWGIGSVGINSVPGVQSSLSSSQTRVQELEFGSLGQAPIAGAVSVPDLTTNVCLVHRLSAGKKTLIDPSASTGQANEADVRFGTNYALGNKTGTLRVPAAGNVALNVPVDNTVGTAVLTAQNVRDAVGLASANLDAQFSAINVDFTPILNRLPAALVNGRMDSSVGAMAANTITAAALAADAVTEIANAVEASNAQQSTLLAVKAKTDLITTGNVTYSGPVDPTGKITAPIIRGDDYLAANGRAFTWTLSAISGLTAATCTSRLGFKSGTTTLVVNGTVTDNGNGTWTASHDMTRTQSATLTQQQYDWSVEIVHSGGTEITPVRSGRGVIVAEKYS